MSEQSHLVEQAWRGYQSKLLTMVRRKVDSQPDAEDIINDVFTRLLQKIDQSETPDNVAAWLYRVTQNRIIDYYRSRKPEAPLPEDLQAENEEPRVLQELSKCLLPMIKALPVSYQEPLILSEIENKKHQEVADELNVSLSAIKSRILRGREKLYKSILDCCTVHRNNSGEIIDFEKKWQTSCDHC